MTTYQLSLAMHASQAQRDGLPHLAQSFANMLRLDLAERNYSVVTPKAEPLPEPLAKFLEALEESGQDLAQFDADFIRQHADYMAEAVPFTPNDVGTPLPSGHYNCAGKYVFDKPAQKKQSRFARFFSIFSK